jgi:hypothetical protein
MKVLVYVLVSHSHALPPANFATIAPLILNDLGQFVGLVYQGKDIVFRFIVEYSSLRDFGP